MNFVEGTRVTKAKHADNSRHTNIFYAESRRNGAVSGCAGEKFHSLLNITIVYPDGIPTFWKFLCGKVKRIIVRFQKMEVPKQLLHGDYAA